jgi:hypothetical protein
VVRCSNTTGSPCLRSKSKIWLVAHVSQRNSKDWLAPMTSNKLDPDSWIVTKPNTHGPRRESWLLGMCNLSKASWFVCEERACYEPQSFKTWSPPPPPLSQGNSKFSLIQLCFLVQTVIDVEMERNLVEHLYSYMGEGEVCSWLLEIVCSCTYPNWMVRLLEMQLFQSLQLLISPP